MRRAASDLRVAYVMSRFPKISETFILYEMEEVADAGVDVHLWPLLRERGEVVHPEARRWMARANYQPFVSPAIIAANLRMLARRPRSYLGALLAMLVGTWGSANFFIGGLGIFPKVVRAAQEMERAGVQHVHCHFASHPALAGFLVRRLTGIPFSFTAHGSDLHVDRHMLPRKVAEASFVVAVSDDNRRLIVEECDGDPTAEDKVIVLHCGVDTTVFQPVERDDRGGPLELLCVGTIHEVKGQSHLLSATRRLIDEGEDVRVTFIGDGPGEQDLRRRSADLGDRIVFRGRRTRPEVATAIADADVVVAPSVPTATGKREGIPVVLMEAMAAGRPVVTSRLSGIPELVEDGVSGLLVPPGDVEALAAAIRSLAADRCLQLRLGSAARSRVVDSFDQRTNARALVEQIRNHLVGST